MTSLKYYRALRLTLATALMFAFGGFNAFAGVDTMFNLTVPNMGGLDCCTGPYASVDVHLVSGTQATVTFDSLTNGNYIYLLAAARAVDLNVNATGFTATETASNSLSGFSTPSFTQTFGKNADGFGSFNLNINEGDGFKTASTQIVVTLTDSSGTWASSANVLTPNAGGSTAAIHGFACPQPGCAGTNSSGAFATGYAANGTAVPEPKMPTLLVAFGGLMATIAGFRKRAAPNV
jgi:hypothetical protein